MKLVKIWFTTSKIGIKLLLSIHLYPNTNKEHLLQQAHIALHDQVKVEKGKVAEVWQILIIIITIVLFLKSKTSTRLCCLKKIALDPLIRLNQSAAQAQECFAKVLSWNERGARNDNGWWLEFMWVLTHAKIDSHEKMSYSLMEWISHASTCFFTQINFLIEAQGKAVVAEPLQQSLKQWNRCGRCEINATFNAFRIACGWKSMWFFCLFVNFMNFRFVKRRSLNRLKVLWHCLREIGGVLWRYFGSTRRE